MTVEEKIEAVELVWDAYVTLLRIPHDIPLRNSAQSVMARCLDFIAEAAGKDAEDIQNDAEMAAANKQKLAAFIRMCKEKQQEGEDG